MTNSFITRLFDLAAPRLCCICGRRLSADEGVLCAPCHLHLPFTRFWLSPTDNPMSRLFWGRVPTAGGLPGQRANSMERAAALFFYEPHAPASKIIYDLKYHGQNGLGTHMGRMAARVMAGSGFFDGVDIIVPVPLTRRRRWSRGYNQSLEIARGVSLATGIGTDTTLLKRTAFAGSQTRRRAWERSVNVEGVFRLTDTAKAEGRHILLVDDVVTTGATIASCANQLCKAHDVRISVFSLGFTSH